MSHNLFGERFAERQGGGRQRAWHGLGQTFTQHLSAQEALEQAGMTYRLAKKPLVVDLTPRDPKTGEIRISPHNGKPVPIQHLPVPNQWAIVREAVTEDPVNRMLGTVGKGYTIMQNTDVAALIDRFSDRWHVETVGALGQGETIFFSMATGSYEIRGDEIQEYVVVSDTRDGTGGQTWMSTSVRVVCQNTLSMGLEEATTKVSLTHSQALAAEAAELASIYSQLQKIQATGRDALRHLADVSVLPPVAETVLEAIYPLPEMPAKVKLAMAVDGAVETPHLLKGKKAWEQARVSTLDWRREIMEGYDRHNDEYPETAQTAYAVYNAVTEFEDHGRRGRNERTRAESALFGDRALVKSRAFDLLSSIG